MSEPINEVNERSKQERCKASGRSERCERTNVASNRRARSKRGCLTRNAPFVGLHSIFRFPLPQSTVLTFTTSLSPSFYTQSAKEHLSVNVRQSTSKRLHIRLYVQTSILLLVGQSAGLLVTYSFCDPRGALADVLLGLVLI